MVLALHAYSRLVLKRSNKKFVDPTSATVGLTHATFDNFVAQHNNVFVFFGFPYDEDCQQVFEKWQRFATLGCGMTTRTAAREMRVNLQVATVDCAEEPQTLRRATEFFGKEGHL